MNARFPFPREHGGYLTLGGAALAGVLLATAAAPAVGFALALSGGFFARGPFERSAPWGRADAVLLSLSSVAVVFGAWLAARAGNVFGIAAGSAALAIVGGAWWARHTREHRAARFEIAAMAILGGAAGPIALAGGLPVRSSLALAIVLGVHAAVSVPLVRSELRPRERPFHGRA